MWWDSTHLSFSGYNSQIKFSPLNCTKDFIYGTKQMILLYNDLYNRWFVIQTGWRSIKIISFLMFHIWLMITICIFQFSLVAQSCPTLCNPMDSSPPGSSVHGISQARILVAISFSRGSSRPRDQTPVYCTAGRFLLTISKCTSSAPTLPIWRLH